MIRLFAKKLLEMIEREDDSLSLIRVLSLLGFVCYMSIYIAAVIWRLELPFFRELTAFITTVISLSIGSKFLDIKMSKEEQQFKTSGKSEVKA